MKKRQEAKIHRNQEAREVLLSVVPSKVWIQILLSGLFVSVLLCTLLLPGSALSATIAKPLSNLSLVSYWSFNEGEGAQAGDFSGNGNNGSLSNSPAWTSGKRGGALSFDGTNDFMTVSQPAIQTSPNLFTIAGWIYPDNKYARFLTPQANGIDNWLGYDHTNQRLEVFITETADVNNRARYSSVGSMPRNAWTHFAVSFNDKVVKIYINGQLDQTHTESINIGGWSGNWIIGQRGNSAEWYQGKMDDVRVYATELSAADIAKLYRAGETLRNVSNNASLVAFWPFNEGNGTQAGDFSGNGNNGSLSNMDAATDWVVGKRGKALDFDGSNDTVSTTALSSVDWTDSYTISLWAKPRRFQNPSSNCGDKRQYILSKGTSSIHVEVATKDASNTIYFRQWSSPGGGVMISRSNFAADAWYHLVAVHDNDADTISFYINNELINSVSTAAHTLTNPTSQTLKIGGGDYNCTNTFFDGVVDDVRVYTRAFSGAEVGNLYRSNETMVNAPQDGRMTSGLMGYWTFNGKDLTTTTASDVSGRGNHGTSTILVPAIGKVGQALSFDGNDRVDLGTTIATGNTNWTASVWIKTTSAGTQFVMTNQSGGPVSNALRIVSGKINYYHYTGVWESESGATSINDGDWHHFAWVNSSNQTMDMYVDGVLDANDVDSYATSNGPLNRIGDMWNPGGQGVNGSLDELRIYNRALSAAEVKQLYLMGK